MRRPSMRSMPPALARAARSVAERIATLGHRTWLVGGAVRDLALEVEPHDVDLASAATPEELERLFAHSVPLGRAFGTLQLSADGVEVQHTTFRSEQGYSDGRRPDAVVFGRSVEEDAARRDFTCNALYLDPLTDDFGDPTGGLADIGERRLRCIGDARARFREDALRLVRMSRLAAALGFAVEPATWDAARAEAPGLARVSAERNLAELERIFARTGSARAIELLHSAGLLAHVAPDAVGAATTRIRALEGLAPVPGTELGLAVLLEPDPEGVHGDLESGRAALQRLRVSRELARAVEGDWRLRRELDALTEDSGAPRARRIRSVRDPRFASALALARALRWARGADLAALDELARWRASLGEPELRPAPLLSSADVEVAGIPRGPQFGAALEALETEQLEGRIATRAQALSWLAERAPR